MTVFGLILMRYFLHYGPISVKKCCVIFCIMRYAIFSLRYTFFKVIMQRTNTVKNEVHQSMHTMHGHVEECDQTVSGSSHAMF